MTSISPSQNNNTETITYGYGPDLQRVLAVLWKNNNLVHLITYGHDYEEKYQDGEITRYWYVNGTDGNCAVYTAHTQTGDKAYCMDMDHLGSVTAMYDQYGTKCYGASFDPWGKRTLMSGSIEFDRGFTGHEHIDEINLIDMNGRMYDPLIGRFLSPDPFVQAPSNPQSYNRYSYCLNNPLKYTDPDGEFVFALVGAILFTTGMTNVIIQASNDNINSFGDAMNAFIGGVAAGVSEGTSLAFGFAELSTGSPLGVLLGHSINFGKSVNFTTTSVNSVLNPVNAAQIFLGRYYTDENGDAWDQALQGFSRFTWEGPQTWAGYNWSQIRSIMGDVDVVDYLGGATFCIKENGSSGSVSLGNYINADLSGNYEGSITKHAVLMHEYGHTFDSREMGPMYLFTIGIPSIISASNYKETEVNGISTTTHRLFWTEQRASMKALLYFQKHYDVDKNLFRTYLPYLFNNQ